MTSSNQQELKCEECSGDLIETENGLTCVQCGLIQLSSLSLLCRGKRIVKIGKLDPILNDYLDNSERRILLRVRGKRLGSKGT